MPIAYPIAFFNERETERYANWFSVALEEAKLHGIVFQEKQKDSWINK
jgi:hypothetical protein